MIPALNDCEIERILDAAAHAGVKEASYVLLRLPLEVRDLFREWLMANYPDRYRHVFTLIRDMRGGRDYDFAMGHADEGHGADGLDDRPALRDRLREARAEQAPLETDDRSFRQAEGRRAAAQFVLGVSVVIVIASEAKQSIIRAKSVDCFVAVAPRNDEGE